MKDTQNSTPLQTSARPLRVVVVGNGMVGHRFCENLRQRDSRGDLQLITIGEERRAAYDRVQLTKYFEHREASRLALSNEDWYDQQGIDLRLGERVETIDRDERRLRTSTGREIDYDRLVLATGSSPFVPPIPGVDLEGVFVYRTIEDLDAIIERASTSQRAAVIGGGLLGLEAAKACVDLGLQTHVIEFAPRLMPRQIDDAGSRVLVQKIEELGVHVHLGTATETILGGKSSGDGDGDEIRALRFQDGTELEVDLLVISAGIRPRDELARAAALEVGERGGVVVDDALQTSDPSIFAIGEVALHRGMCYGLVAPGYDMADILASRLLGEECRFEGSDLSTKLKLMGVDVASFGEYEEGPDRCPLIFEDPFEGVYKKLLFDREGEHLLGGILVGDASDYATLSSLVGSPDPLPMSPAELIGRRGKGAPGGDLALPETAQVCSCNGVSKGEICQVIREEGLTTLDGVKTATRAGSGCGGCLPLVISILHDELEAAGKTVKNVLCEHFDCSREELCDIVKITGIRTFPELIEAHGQGSGCEICKPTAASIFASLWNEPILSPEHETLQDTNDRFLANMQRGGLFSVVPRVPGGEITPDQLIVLGEVAKKYDLYTKITGGQRVDLFGAEVHELPDIWEELIAAGFESGHAYGKALRTVKSCVGTTWCRYGIGDSVGFAIRVEKRYRGIRAPHKIKSAVSGCTRECAEAQSKDFGLIATENGYNLYVGGNGGTRPRHAQLLADDLDEESCLKLIDRFLMYYILTADKLTRTATWVENLPGGLERLKEIVIDDALGICEELERRMQHLVDTYRCEWKDVVEDPARRARFRQFTNSGETETGIEIITERGQRRPADWARDGVSIEAITLPDGRTLGEARREAPASWVEVGGVEDFPVDGGATVLHGKTQIAVFRFASRGTWYATQNLCPHKKSLVLSRGLIGDAGGEPKVSCPLHKAPFSLRTGECLKGDLPSLETFPVRVEGDRVYLRLPPESVLDEGLSTALACSGACSTAT